jgi:cytochrome c biogenesis factor
MMLILIGYCLSYGIQTETTVTLQEGERRPVGDFVIELEEIYMVTESDEIMLNARIKLTESDEIIVEDRISKGVISGGVYLKHELDRDIYVTLDSVNPATDISESTATITVREIPGIILVWTGTILTILGMISTMFTEWEPGKKWLRSIGK